MNDPATSEDIVLISHTFPVDLLLLLGTIGIERQQCVGTECALIYRKLNWSRALAARQIEDAGSFDRAVIEDQIRLWLNSALRGRMSPLNLNFTPQPYQSPG